MNTKFKDFSLVLTILALATIILTLLVWLPHILALPNFWGLNFKEGFNTIYRNFDGLEYIVIAKTYYDPSLLVGIPQSLPLNYYAAHFPGYSALISLFAPLLGFLKSMLFVSLVSTILSVWAFYLLLRDFKLTAHPLFLSLLFLILPARWLVVHSVGASEPLFIFLMILTIYLVMKFEQSKQYYFVFLAALTGMLAQITRPPGVLLFLAIGLYTLWNAYRKKSVSSLFSYTPFILMPLSLIGIFYLFQLTLGDFWAYFHSGDNIHITFPPFQVFNKDQFWVGDIWLEDLVYIFTLGFLGGVMLLKQKLHLLGIFVLTYLTASIFIAHRDISRYILPITPFILIAFEKVLTSKEFKIILPIIALAIYLYAQNFILANTAPIPDVSIFN